MIRALAIILTASIAMPGVASAKDSLGVYSQWAAFRDPGAPRCYAIAQPSNPRLQPDYAPFASIGTWPSREIRNQLHIRLSRELANNPRILLTICSDAFELVGGGGDAWAQDARMDAAIIAAIRSGSRMSVSARAKSGERFVDRYDLDGVATAIDAAVVGCAEA